jgi:hypothetical protein
VRGVPGTRAPRRMASVVFLCALLQGPQGEGPIGNDVFLPVSDAAAKELAAGDTRLAAPGDDAAAQRTAAFDAWYRALEASDEGDSAPMPEIQGLARGSESVDRGVVRRLRAAGAPAIAAWRARFDSIAAAALAAAGVDAEALARIDRGFPLTRAAARAALALADLGLEAGDPVRAGTWLARARAHADPADAPLAAAIARRGAAAKNRLDAPAAAWRTAEHLVLEGQVALEGFESGRRGVEPGTALLLDGSVCVQCSGDVHVVGTDRRVRSAALADIGRARGWSWVPPFADQGERWLLRPASDGTRIALVVGRASQARGNALLFLDASLALSWGYSDAGFVGPDGSQATIDELLGPGLWEFEPGPAIVGGSIVVQAHQWLAETGEPPSVDERAVRAWCLALDLESGRPRWKRLLAIGASGKGRLRGPRGFARAAQPVAVQDGRVLAGTGIGAGAILDVGDGRVVATWKFRRAPEGAAAWSPCAPLAAGALVAWAPPESDRMYFLDASDPLPSDAPFTLPPREIGDDVLPLAADRARAVFLARSGGRTVLARVVPATNARAESPALPLAERFPPCGAVSGARAILASDRAAYLFDVGEDVRLLDAVTLPGRDGSVEAGVSVSQDRILVAGERTLWILRLR